MRDDIKKEETKQMSNGDPVSVISGMVHFRSKACFTTSVTVEREEREKKKN